MPREHRKRGRKHKKPVEEAAVADEIPIHPEPSNVETAGQPSWIVPASKPSVDVNPEAPFGYVDADVKAYFKTVDLQIRDWQENKERGGEDEGDTDPNEQRRLFFVAALTEMQGKEKELATDPDCSVVLERMSHSMDDFVRRVFIDSLAGSYEILVRHRFASHVCQTLFTVARDTVSREAKGIFPAIPDSEEQGELRTLTRLILDISEELLPTLSSLIMDSFASHVIRSLLILLSARLSNSDDQSAVRSKKSAVWKAKQGKMKSVFDDDGGGNGDGAHVTRAVPPEFEEMARQFVEVVREQLDPNAVRALAANKVACPGLQMLVEVEANQNMMNEPGSLMDSVLAGIITSCHKDPASDIEPSDYVGTLLRDPTSSHLLETLTLRCPNVAFDKLWDVYFKGKLPRLGVHPVANFVLATALERASNEQLSEAFEELNSQWAKMISTSRTGVLRAVIDRAVSLQVLGEEVTKAVNLALDLTSPEDKLLLVPCILPLLPLQDYKNAMQPWISDNNNDESQERPKSYPESLEPKIQGAILLQSLLKLPEPHNHFVIASIFSLSIEDRIRIAHSTSGSRVYDVLFESPSISAKNKRQFVIDLIGHYHVLVDDRIGSRVGDRCWNFADTYLKEKIARSLIQYDQTLAGSFYGKFFARNLHLYLLQRRPEEWRNMQADSHKRTQQPQGTNVAANKAPVATFVSSEKGEPPPLQAAPTKRRHSKQSEDEIDAVFNAALGKKPRTAALGADGKIDSQSEISSTLAKPLKGVRNPDKELQNVLGAIRLVPKDSKGSRKKRKRSS